MRAWTLPPRVSVVVLTHNRCRELCRTLGRLNAQPDSHPIVVVDNGSADGTASTVLRQFPDVLLIRAGANLGAAGRNLGVERVTTPYVAFCDDDTWWGHGSLERAADVLDRHADIAVLNACISVGAGEREDPACAAMACSPLPRVAGVGPELTGFMAGACVMRVGAFRLAGGYWRPFFIGGEEALLAQDIMAEGGRIVYAPQLHVHHWPSLARDGALRRRMLARNALWTAWLRLPPALALARSLSILRGVPAWGARIQALRDACAHWRTIRAHRRPLDASICAKLKQVWSTQAGR
ncbi:glycosyltransferase family 2 protein [Achromobacter sp. K91]|uniref:glycosyltransferase family 2 protein n=1 Tax=Achromobacter sp. K91 TaxID=2292262 RepID=UPI002102868A|nr:glycosyltransferase family 2 protein [Achromobacter sp. K91]